MRKIITTIITTILLINALIGCAYTGNECNKIKEMSGENINLDSISLIKRTLG